MDVIFETQKGTSFCTEIGFFDTVLEIKEKIQKYRDIPVTQQTLILDGKVLEDGGTVESCNIFQNSHIRLIVVAHEPEEQPKIKIEEQSPVSMKVQLLLRLPTPKSQKIAVQMELSDTVEQLKKKINEIEGFPANRLVLHANENTEMQDHTCLHEYHLTDGSEIDITVRPSSATSGTSAAAATAANVSGSKRLNVMVLPPGGTEKMAVEVGAWEKVQVLRNELDKLQKRCSFDLPEEYFFIYNQAVMEERESFRWHSVCHGDTIEIFSGSVTVGS